MGIYVAFRGNVKTLTEMMEAKTTCPVALVMAERYRDLLSDIDEDLDIIEEYAVGGHPPGREKVTTMFRRLDLLREKTLTLTMFCPNPVCPETESAREALEDIRKNNLVRRVEYAGFVAEGFTFYDRAEQN